MITKTCLSALLAFSILLVTGVSESTAQKKRPPASQDRSEVDEDFRYQGEYMGYVSTDPGTPYVTKVGLQIVARGDGAFDAVLFSDGLPGDGGGDEAEARAIGKLEGDIVTATLGEYQIEVGGNLARFADSDGVSLGEIRKYDRRSATLGAEAPDDAIVLFNGEKNDLWKNMNVTDEGLLKEGCETVNAYGDFKLHLEFRLPYKPLGTSQDRGNSGVYLQRRYEVQVLDSFGDPLAYNHCGAIYKVREPDLNMCLPPLSWQTYDIHFRSARFDDEGNKTENMKIRVWQNGIVIHDGVEIPNKTGAGRPEGPDPMAILLQDHGNPVRYRNIWLVEGDPFVEQPATEEKDVIEYAEVAPYWHGGYHHGGDYWPYNWKYRYAPLAPPAPQYMLPNYDLPPYPYGYYPQGHYDYGYYPYGYAY